MKFLFFLYAYNDVDQITPVMWKALQCGYEVQAVLLDPAYDGAADPRLQFLSDFSAFRLWRAEELQFGLWARPARHIEAWMTRHRQGRVGRYVGHVWTAYCVREARRWLSMAKPDVCVFEWGAFWSRLRRDFLTAAHNLGIGTVALPHGLNIYLNRDVNPGVAEDIREQRLARKEFNCYDAYVFQSEYHRDFDVHFGMNPEMTRVLGSARYCPEWQRINLQLYSPFEPEDDPEDRLKLVFMMPHWEYNVDRAGTLEALQQLAQQDWLHLVVKEHTRGSGDLPEELRACPGIETANEVPSVSLIRWADAVINFGSSIGIEAILQGKHQVIPDYLHTNKTIFAESGAGVFAYTLPELLSKLRAIREDTVPLPTPSARQKLLATVVYGGEERDVLAAYVALLEEAASGIERISSHLREKGRAGAEPASAVRMA